MPSCSHSVRSCSVQVHLRSNLRMPIPTNRPMLQSASNVCNLFPLRPVVTVGWAIGNPPCAHCSLPSLYTKLLTGCGPLFAAGPLSELPCP